MRTWAFFLALAACCHGESIADRIEKYIQSSPAARQAFWGVRIVDPETGEIVYEKNADHFFVPASNTKLYSTSLALLRLGPDYRYVTRVLANSTPDSTGRLIGDVVLAGAGDPNLSGRTIPYIKDDPLPDPLAKLKILADQVVAKGVRTIDGDLIGDDTAYAWEPYPPGWAADDAPYEYGAPVSALTVNDNTINLVIRAGNAIGEPATLAFDPPLESLVVHNRTRTQESRSNVDYDRLPGSNELIVSGPIQIGPKEVKTRIAVNDPALYAAECLRMLLLERGVVVRGKAAARHRREEDPAFMLPTAELASYTSAPLSDALRIVDKDSQNLHAEMVLREVARKETGFGTRREGVKQLSALLKEIGVSDKQYAFHDGSGLSRLTLTSPETTTRLLLRMWRSPVRDVWTSLLPIGGDDGTLDKRFKGFANASVVHAKTGSLSHVAALSGYLLPPGGRPLIFSVMTNNFNAPAAEVRAVADKIVMEFVSPQ